MPAGATTLHRCSQQPTEGREVVAAQVPEGVARVVEVVGEAEAAEVEAEVDPEEAVAFREEAELVAFREVVEVGAVNGSRRRPCSWECLSPATSRPR